MNETRNALPGEMERLTGQKGHGEGFTPNAIVPQSAILVNVNLDNKPYYSKADAAREYGAIRNRLGQASAQRRIDLAELPGIVCKGYAFTPALMNGTTRNTWASQQVFCADIDNDKGTVLTPDEAAEIMSAAGIAPAFMYYTFSSTEERPRFRVIVATSEAVTDPDKADRIRKGFAALFPGQDATASDAAKMYQGTNKGMALEYVPATVDADRLEKLYFDLVEPVQPKAAPRPVVLPGTNDLADAIESFDLAGYIESTTGTQGKRMGAQVRFNPCPLCGHKDHFDVMGNVFTARGSADNDAGGNIINYLEALNGWSREQARDYFMYEIMGWDKEARKQEYREKKRMERVERITHEKPADTVPDFVIEKRDKNGEITSRYISAPILAQCIREREHYIFTRDGAMSGVNRFWYSGGYYRQVSDDEIKGIIKGYIERYDFTLLRMKDVNEVFQQLTTDRVFHDNSELNAAENLVNFLDGVLDMETGVLHPHSPRYLMTRQIPVKWADGEGMSAPTFHNYMMYLCDGKTEWGEMSAIGAERYKVLMQFMGACVSNVRGHRFKKALFMYGPGDTGKSQLKSLAEYMIGSENCCPCDLGQLEARFGTSTIYNKRLIGSSDMPFLTVNEMDTFKQITGGDNLFAEYKGRNGFSFVFDGLAWFCMNRLPRFGGDQGEWVYNRIIPVECPHVVPDAMRDRGLLDKMKQEAPAIIREALSFLMGAINDGYRFSEPSDAANVRKEYRQDNDTVAAFISECCVEVASPGENLKTVREWENNRNAPNATTIYRVYKDWCHDYENGYSLKAKDFRAAVISMYGQPEKRASGMVYRGFCLKEEYAIFNGGY